VSVIGQVEFSRPEEVFPTTVIFQGQTYNILQTLNLDCFPHLI